MELMETYHTLLNSFGSQGWWPMDNSFRPKEWEVIIGAILTQNTSWSNVEKALKNLRDAGVAGPKEVQDVNERELQQLVRPSGFFRQKAERLKGIAAFMASYGNFNEFSSKVEREDLLSVKGIGRETADSILLYALGRPHFVVDAYTMRIFSRMGLIGKDWNYEKTKEFSEKNIEKDEKTYKEFHALIVSLGKNFCRKKPLCYECPLRKGCKNP